MKTIAYIMSTYHIGTHNLDIRDILKSHIIARYILLAIYEVLTMPREKITI